MVIESKVQNVIIIILYIVDTVEAVKTKEDVFLIGTTHTRYTNSMELFPQKQLYTQLSNGGTK